MPTKNVFQLYSSAGRRRLLANWAHVFERLLPLGGRSSANHVRLLASGDDDFSVMLEAISKARTHVWLETYIFEPDTVGVLFRDALADAARRGCDVILLYDHFGSVGLSEVFLEPIIQAGGKAVAFNPIWPWRRQKPFLFRDHRKILIVDQLQAFCGSYNIGIVRFRDTVIQIEGPGVTDLANLFLTSLAETTGDRRVVSYEGPSFNDGVSLQVLGSNTHRNLTAIQKSMELTLERSTRTCYFTTPYFLPYERLRKAILKAASRGVDVRILTAGLSDVPLMRLASQHVYGQFLDAGIRIYELFGQTLHAKTATIDGVYGTVGSYNLDHWSARRNLEVNVSVFNEAVAMELQKQFMQDLEGAKEVTRDMWHGRSWFSRVIQWLAYQVMRL